MKEVGHEGEHIRWFHLLKMSGKVRLGRQKVDERLLGLGVRKEHEESFRGSGMCEARIVLVATQLCAFTNTTDLYSNGCLMLCKLYLSKAVKENLMLSEE